MLICLIKRGASKHESPRGTIGLGGVVTPSEVDTNLASGSSSVSRFSHSVEMMLSYLFGYFLKISCKQIHTALRNGNHLLILITDR